MLPSNFFCFLHWCLVSWRSLQFFRCWRGNTLMNRLFPCCKLFCRNSLNSAAAWNFYFLLWQFKELRIDNRKATLYLNLLQNKHPVSTSMAPYIKMSCTKQMQLHANIFVGIFVQLRILFIKCHDLLHYTNTMVIKGVKLINLQVRTVL